MCQKNKCFHSLTTTVSSERVSTQNLTSRSRYGCRILITTSNDTSSIDFKMCSIRDGDRNRMSVKTGRIGTI